VRLKIAGTTYIFSSKPPFTVSAEPPR
jgi:hypothetical protein